MTSPFGTAVLIANVRSGKGGVGKALPEVEAAMTARGLDYEIRRTEHRGHAIEIAREVVSSGGRFVVAMGGDGTVHEVVNGMMKDDKAINPDAVMGVVAAGTGCDFIKTFGMPAKPIDAVRHLDGGESFLIDIGKITYLQDGVEVTRYFPNIAEVGLGAACVARAEKLPRWLGPTVYLVSFWLTMRKHKPAQVKIDVVDRVYEGLMNNMVVANGQFFGGGMKIAPKAAPTDGLLDIQVEHARKKDAIAMMPKVFKGQHVPHPDIEEYKRVRCSITSDRELPIEADGEVLGTTPASFEVISEAIQLKV
ncbi:MAG: diacylglycerol kinase [Actinomycetota bacterium]|jgi:YegS/Rv2252/BmrU family lipid kinase|nr:diacylglycerol kinase [Actinomycetota bacterium]